MRGLIITVLIVALLFFAGWLQYSTTDGDPTIRVDTEEVKEDTAKMVEKANQLAGKVGESIDAKPNEEEDSAE
ncbi:DUF3810 domain-containing protein [Roseiconus nitratireducens]|uniref:DUF3810 domain-containing protein n=1 Tax=Roseiconus nitratireducens TaxID=2605748 RepID=A0A5M6DHK9_9BACT|nr:DUF3810 domain-containing protein [Roseiconus nitratireducens]KAA5545866.1 DUF3810 domain-containing protein [Roseiconus nitratireducens]